jgi:hypothetical protein
LQKYFRGESIPRRWHACDLQLEPAVPVNRSVEKASQYKSSRRGRAMKKLFGGIAVAAMVALAVPVWAQGVTTKGEPVQDNPPGAAGTSKPGVPGLPGSKSGPTVTPSGKTAPEANSARPSGDQSGVRGLPGNKSGPAVTPPGSGR